MQLPERDPYPPARVGRGPAVNNWLVAILLILVAVLLYRLWGAGFAPLHNPNAVARVVTARGDLAEDEKAQIDLFEAASPSVAHVTSVGYQRDSASFNILEVPTGTGSGFIWDTEGHVVTNLHVIQNARARITVLLADNSSWDGKIVGVDEYNDIAVLKIDAPTSRLTPIPVGQSANLKVGQKVFAIGNPFSLDQTLTTGIISGLGRNIPTRNNRTISDGIQTDAAINPGNSGGPLLDSSGRLIGMNTAIVSLSGAYAGIGFAVPVDTVNQVVPQLIRTGRPDRPGMGIVIYPDQIVERLIALGELDSKGVLVRYVGEGTSAAAAGVRATEFTDQGEAILGDLITAIDGDKIETSSDLQKALGRKSIGDKVEVTLRRKGQDEKVSVTLQSVQNIALPPE